MRCGATAGDAGKQRQIPISITCRIATIIAQWRGSDRPAGAALAVEHSTGGLTATGDPIQPQSHWQLGQKHHSW